MSKKRGTSSSPMVLGIIGGVLGLPGAICSGACAAGITVIDASNTAAEASQIGDFYMNLGFIGAILGLIFGILSKRFPIFSGIVMIMAAIFAGITLIAGNMLALIVTILFLLGGFLSIFQKKEEIVI